MEKTFLQLLQVNWSARCSLRKRNVSVDMKCMAVKSNVLLVRWGCCSNGVGNSISSPRHPFIRCRVGSPCWVWASLWRHVQIRTLCNLLSHTLQLLILISSFTKKKFVQTKRKTFLQKLCFLAASHRKPAACPAFRAICRCQERQGVERNSVTYIKYTRIVFYSQN